MGCHDTLATPILQTNKTLALVGHPNVGKSVIFNHLTGQRVTISNFPGTTVEISRSALSGRPHMQLVDTPGIITLPAHSQEEIVTEKMLMSGEISALVQVGDAKNLRRTLLLTSLLLESGYPLILTLNMVDEAHARGVQVDFPALSAALGVPVVPTVAVHGQGISKIISALEKVQPPACAIPYPQPIEDTLAAIETLLPETPFAARGTGLLWLLNDPVIHTWIAENLPAQKRVQLQNLKSQLEQILGQPPAMIIQQIRQHWVEKLLENTLQTDPAKKQPALQRLSTAMTHPIWGIPFLILALAGLYWFVGIFGAGTMVDWLEGTLFGQWVNPHIIEWVTRWLPVPWLRDLLVGEYGLWTMGMTYALALILPIVVTFFLAFGVLEDSGYLPRLAAFTNQAFARIGLNGKAVVPIVLGLGCVTMATLSTRVLESRRERILATLLLALAIPCSAQLGVVMGMLASLSLSATLIWAGVVLTMLFGVGYLAAKLVPGERSPLVIELPPLRRPQLANIVLKTSARLEWYLKEVVPLFLIGTALLFTLDRLHILPWLAHVSQPLITGWLGLPAKTSTVFIMGFLRRDFGATGLFMMQNQGLLTPLQVVIAMVAITLFVPCFASVLMIAREHGKKITAGLVTFIFPFAFFISGALYRVLLWAGWR